MLNKEMFLAREKPLSLTITNIGTPGYLTIKFLPGNKIETDVWEFPLVYSKSMLEGQTKIEISCGIPRAFYDYSISGQGVSIDYFDHGDTMISFNLSSSGGRCDNHIKSRYWQRLICSNRTSILGGAVC